MTKVHVNRHARNVLKGKTPKFDRAVKRESRVMKIMAYEDGELDDNETIDLYSDLLKDGMAWKLQGHYGRTANDLIKLGYLSPDGKVLRYPS